MIGKSRTYENSGNMINPRPRRVWVEGAFYAPVPENPQSFELLWDVLLQRYQQLAEEII